jgi:hypothetical protein
MFNEGPTVNCYEQYVRTLNRTSDKSERPQDCLTLWHLMTMATAQYNAQKIEGHGTAQNVSITAHSCTAFSCHTDL